MSIESEAFLRRRFLPEALLRYGFTREEGGYRYVAPLMDGDFRADVIVTDGGEVCGTLMDCMNDEEYMPLRNERYEGAYVNTVRAAYAAFLSDIAAHCTTEVYFASDQANRVTATIMARYGVAPDFPWGRSPHENSGVFRHLDTAKWFGLIMNVRRGLLTHDEGTQLIDVMNLRIDPAAGDELRARTGVYAAYHMNHTLWISVALDDTLSDEDVMALVADSFRLTGK